VSVIVAENLSKRYGRRMGIEELDLSVPEGTLFGFLGPNGSGKTTTIRILLGFLRAGGGSARILGRDCWRDSHRIKRDVGYLPGDLRLYSWMNGHGALRIFGGVRGLDLAAAGRELAERFGLDLTVRARSMSRGMRQKLGLILALVHEPKLLILDEPTSSLDPLMQELLNEHLRSLARRGHTVFFSSHTLSEVEHLCDRVAILREGRLVADESLEVLRRRAGREVIIRWKAEPATPPPSPPPFLRVRQQQDRQWRCALAGPIAELLAWLAPLPVDDVVIGRPDLESLFRSYYSRQAGAGA